MFALTNNLSNMSVIGFDLIDKRRKGSMQAVNLTIVYGKSTLQAFFYCLKNIYGWDQ